ncbi:hypothetical protein [Clostridium sp.]|uniref:hypothetical protein n=1 Tax=Clostridium sp. TaxID=1506 RepID=UPI002904A352|nr:hypothetical protein [Clostridium sp.]MDU2106341.1 hypothetical protein [Clostridium sp.]MDU3352785.1 hypothetical protein [Clostridium sp.]MDU6047145.1 hypothetical protein [Clostridium sp.]MDU6220557.1 hypothetical protein [Clostridium sp.]MDU6270960.1 hypothetical protein [Clostridium sp.]
MGAFISRQPNGLYCRFSTIVDCPTHYNMTEEDYINNVTGTVKSKNDGLDTLKNHLRPFKEVIESYRPTNMELEEFTKIVNEMSKNSQDGIFRST